MPTLAPRRKTAPGNDSPESFLTSASSLINPILVGPQRSMDWIVRERRVKGVLWNGCLALLPCKERFF